MFGPKRYDNNTSHRRASPKPPQGNPSHHQTGFKDTSSLHLHEKRAAAQRAGRAAKAAVSRSPGATRSRVQSPASAKGKDICEKTEVASSLSTSTGSTCGTELVASSSFQPLPVPSPAPAAVPAVPVNSEVEAGQSPQPSTITLAPEGFNKEFSFAPLLQEWQNSSPDVWMPTSAQGTAQSDPGPLENPSTTAPLAAAPSGTSSVGGTAGHASAKHSSEVNLANRTHQTGAQSPPLPAQGAVVTPHWQQQPPGRGNGVMPMPAALPVPLPQPTLAQSPAQGEVHMTAPTQLQHLTPLRYDASERPQTTPRGVRTAGPGASVGAAAGARTGEGLAPLGGVKDAHWWTLLQKPAPGPTPASTIPVQQSHPHPLPHLHPHRHLSNTPRPGHTPTRTPAPAPAAAPVSAQGPLRKLPTCEAEALSDGYEENLQRIRHANVQAVREMDALMKSLHGVEDEGIAAASARPADEEDDDDSEGEHDSCEFMYRLVGAVRCRS